MGWSRPPKALKHAMYSLHCYFVMLVRIGCCGNPALAPEVDTAWGRNQSLGEYVCTLHRQNVVETVHKLFVFSVCCSVHLEVCVPQVGLEF